mmetsp:Transcript_21746/g.47422  ORF Transcript_21746/g.47422 Transcript_21746/m.47422 type:complete len:237 (+) Transcript_21746:347-1057(+)
MVPTPSVTGSNPWLHLVSVTARLVRYRTRCSNSRPTTPSTLISRAKTSSRERPMVPRTPTAVFVAPTVPEDILLLIPLPPSSSAATPCSSPLPSFRTTVPPSMRRPPSSVPTLPSTSRLAVFSSILALTLPTDYVPTSVSSRRSSSFPVRHITSVPTSSSPAVPSWARTPPAARKCATTTWPRFPPPLLPLPVCRRSRRSATSWESLSRLVIVRSLRTSSSLHPSLDLTPRRLIRT